MAFSSPDCQVSLAKAIAVATAPCNVILLAIRLSSQVSHGWHPDGVGVSVLEHLLGVHATVPHDPGDSLEENWRMHPDAFVVPATPGGRETSVPVTPWLGPMFKTSCTNGRY